MKNITCIPRDSQYVGTVYSSFHLKLSEIIHTTGHCPRDKTEITITALAHISATITDYLSFNFETKNTAR